MSEHSPLALGEQRKLLSILFVDLAGSTAIAERLDPEDWRGVQSRYFAFTSRHIQRFGGTIDKYIGDAVMAVFGAPISHEDDAQRAISTALAIQADVRKENEALRAKYGVELTLRLGINTGEVVAGMLTGDVQAAYTVTGDAVNTAQRLESAAPPNEILVSESTYALARREFIFERLAPIVAKGKKEPIPVYRVVGRRAEPSAEAETSPFVGREAELAHLRRLLFEATAGRGQLVHLNGEPGVGKSRLIQEFLALVPASAAPFRARCLSYETGTPYALVADLLRRALHIHRTDEEDRARAAVVAGLAPLGIPAGDAAIGVLLEVLGYESRSALDPESKRRLVLSNLRHYLRRQAALATLVIVAEDIHWMDSASADLLAQVVPEVAGIACLLLTTSREEDSPWQATAIRLEPLVETDAAQMLERLAAAPLDAAARAAVLERTGGNPFFIEEVLHAIAARGAAEIPATVQEVLEARLDALEPAARRVAERAAVIGRAFGLRVLARVTVGEELERALAALASQRFIVPRETIPEPTFAFRHALVQEVVYHNQLATQRRLLHGVVGAAIEELYPDRVDEFTDVLAFHYDRSELDEKALRWLVRAGDRAKALFANAEAVTLYRAALRRAQDGDGALDAGSILERIGDVQTTASNFDDAVASFRSARLRLGAPTPSAIARLHRKTGNAQVREGAHGDAFSAYAEGIAALEGASDPESGQIWVRVGVLQTIVGNHAEARAAMSRALGIGLELDADEVAAEALTGLGNAATMTGHLKEAEDFLLRALRIYEKLEDLTGIAEVRNLLGIAYRRMGRPEDALAQYRAALGIHERIGNRFRMAFLYNNIGYLQMCRGDLAEAIRSYEHAIELHRSFGDEAGMAAPLMNLGLARVEAGDAAQGRADLLDAERRFVSVHNTLRLPPLYRYLASAELALGNIEAASDAANRSLEIAAKNKVRHQEAMTKRVLAEIAVARGETNAARALLEESRGALAELGEVDELRRTEAVLKVLGG